MGDNWNETISFQSYILVTYGFFKFLFFKALVYILTLLKVLGENEALKKFMCWN